MTTHHTQAGHQAALDLITELCNLEPEGPGPADLLGTAIYDALLLAHEGDTQAALQYLAGFAEIIGPVLVEGIELANPELRQPDLEARP